MLSKAIPTPRYRRVSSYQWFNLSLIFRLFEVVPGILTGTVFTGFHAEPDPIPDPKSESSSRNLINQKFGNFTIEKNSYFWIKKCNIFISSSPRKTSNLQKRPPDFKRGHPTLQKTHFFTFFCFRGSFLPSWIRIHFPNTGRDPDPANQNYLDCWGKLPVNAPTVRYLVRRVNTSLGFHTCPCLPNMNYLDCLGKLPVNKPTIDIWSTERMHH